MKRYIFIFISIFFCISIIGCSGIPSEQSLAPNPFNTSSLRIYTASGRVETLYRDGTKDTQYIPMSTAALGMNIGTLDAEMYNPFYQAILDFGEEYNISIDCVFFSSSVELMQQLKQDMGTPSQPDLVFVDKQFNQNFTTLVKQNMIEDLSPFLDESIFDSEKYEQRVLDACRVDEKIYALPCLFNIPGFVTSSEFLTEIGASTPSVNSSFSDIMNLFQVACKAMIGDNRAALIETTCPFSTYIGEILRQAGAESANAALPDDILDLLINTLDIFYQQEFSLIPKHEEKNFDQLDSNMDAKARRFEKLPLVTSEPLLKPSNIGILLDGGTNGSNFFSSFLAQAFYMDDFYEKQNLHSVICGIPSSASPHSYNANILNFGFLPKGTQNPEAACALLQRIIDTTYPMWYGFSFNKENHRTLLQNAMETEYQIQANFVGDFPPNDPASETNYDNMAVWLKPLRPEVAATIQDMLDHIGHANLPNSSIANVYQSQLKNYWMGLCTREELTQNIRAELELLDP